MDRTPEPELMDTADQAAAYASANFTESNELFVSLVRRHLGPQLEAGGRGARFVDLGCGPADIPLRLLGHAPGLHVDAVDGSHAMLAEARRAVDAAGEAGRVHLITAYLPAVPFAEPRHDGVLSNSLLHHLHDPDVFWQSVRACGRPGAGVVVMDLKRPADEAEVDRLDAAYTGGEAEVLRRDFRNSLHAAFTVDEVRRQLAAAGLDGLEVGEVSDRHLAVWGVLR